MKKLLFLIAIISMVAVSCGTGTSEKKEKGAELTAAGATFPMPFYNLAFKKYGELTTSTVTYGGIGSGGGIRSLQDRVVDFGASDAFLSDGELAGMGGDVIHVPTCLGAVVIAYNLPGIDELKLTPALLEGIFMGKITKWDDAAISAVNEGVKLPDQNITVVYRSDGSGTTYIFSDYMSKVSQAWADQIGTGKSLNWPVGIGAKGNPGVSGTISQSEGTIGYVGSEYAFAQKISYASLLNMAGNYVKPGLASVSAAASGEIPQDTRIMITNSDAPGAYPVSGFTWILLFREQAYNGRTEAQARATVDLIKWMLDTDAQAIASSVNYAPLPDRAVKLALENLSTVTYEGQALAKK